MTPSLRVAIVHYHFRRGGVTRVAEHAVEALATKGVQCVLLSGEPPPPDFPLRALTHTVDGLAYRADSPGGSANTLATDLATAAREAFGAPPDLWHVHNHGLGKNPALTEAVRVLASTGHRMLLHIHDLAEDNRPALFGRLLAAIADGDVSRLATYLYPQAEHIHYAVLSRRDHAALSAAGLPSDRLHLLPNAVAQAGAGPLPPPDPKAQRRFLYPTRAIRRKNLGEFLLWAALAEPGDRYAVTLAPDNPEEQPAYRKWVALAAELDLPIEFECGSRSDLPFADLLASAAATVTTSIAEGFGLAFLEPWLAGRPVLGRDLPEITADFEAHGIDLGTLYRHVRIPSDWVDANALRTNMANRLEQTNAAYGRPARPDDADRAMAAATVAGGFDFACLGPGIQRTIIRHVAASRTAAHEILPPALMPPESLAAVTTANRAKIAEHFSLAAYGNRLMDLYGRLMQATPGPVHSGVREDTVLDQFLAPERFNMLRA